MRSFLTSRARRVAGALLFALLAGTASPRLFEARIAIAADRPPAPTGTPILADSPLVFDTNLGLIERTTTQAVEEALQGITLEPGAAILLHPQTTSEGRWFVEDCIARVLSQKGYRVHLAKDPAASSAVPPAGGAPPAAGAGAPPAAGAVAPAPGGLGDMVQQGNTPAGSTAPDSTGDAGDPSTSNPPPEDPGVTLGPGGRKINPAFQDMQARALAQQSQTPSAPIPPLPDDAGLVLTYRIVEFGVTYHDSWRRGFLGPRVVERLASVDLYTRLVNGSVENVLWAGRGRAERLDIVPKSKLDLLEGRTYPFTRPVLTSSSLSRLAEPVLVTGIITGLVFLFYSSQN